MRIEQPVSSCTRSSSGPSASVSFCATPAGRFVEQEDAGVLGRMHARSTMRRVPVDSSPGELLAEGAQTHEIDQFVDALRSDQLRFVRRRQVQGGGHHVLRLDVPLEGHGDRLGHGQRRVEAGVLERAAEAVGGPLVGRPVGDLVVAQEHLAPVDRQEARDAVEQRRLARPVGADEAEDLPWRSCRSTSSTARMPPKRFVTSTHSRHRRVVGVAVRHRIASWARPPVRRSSCRRRR